MSPGYLKSPARATDSDEYTWWGYARKIKLLPKADIVHDKFHVAKYLNEAVDKVRRQEHKALKGQDSGILAGTKYLWLANPNNWTAAQKASFKELKDIGLKVGRAWAIKETFGNFWNYSYVKSATKFFRKWFFWATHSRLDSMIKAAKTIERHFNRVITYLKHRITNAVAEGLNSKIQQIKAMARGFRNFDNYRIAILFHCGKLSMYPHKCQ
ncbi:MAG: transposase [Candidatus Aquicultor sp.]|nr:transposase [Candidatus Aquicultor sp.]